jgi:hypothetical protein
MENSILGFTHTGHIPGTVSSSCEAANETGSEYNMPPVASLCRHEVKHRPVTPHTFRPVSRRCCLVGSRPLVGADLFHAVVSSRTQCCRRSPSGRCGCDCRRADGAVHRIQQGIDPQTVMRDHFDPPPHRHLLDRAFPGYPKRPGWRAMRPPAPQRRGM